jgi:hypothetical protein
VELLDLGDSRGLSGDVAGRQLGVDLLAVLGGEVSCQSLAEPTDA